MPSVCTSFPVMQSHSTSMDEVYSRVNEVVLKAMKTEALILSVSVAPNTFDPSYNDTYDNNTFDNNTYSSSYEDNTSFDTPRYERSDSGIGGCEHCRRESLFEKFKKDNHCLSFLHFSVEIASCFVISYIVL